MSRSLSATGRTLSTLGVLTSKQNILVGLILIALAALVFVLSLNFFGTFVEGSPGYVPVIFALSVILALILATIVFGRLWVVWRYRQVGMAGSRMHLRLVGILTVVAIVPTAIAFFFSALVLQAFSQEFFVDRVRAANITTENLANSYFSKLSNQIGFDMLRTAVDLDRREVTGAGLQDNPIGFRQYLYGQAVLRNWAAVYVLDGDKRILAKIVNVQGFDYLLPPRKVFDELDAGRDVASRFNFNAQDSEQLGIYRGVLKIKPYGGGYLIAFYGDIPVMTQGILAARDFRDNAQNFNQRLDDLRGAFTTGYGLLALIFLLLAVWLGLFTATAIVAPIRRLATAAEKISGGDLKARVEVHDGDGELGDLGNTFNRMTGQLETQRNDLIRSNEQSDDRRRFIEAVLSGVSAGVMGVTDAGKITIANVTAAEFLKAKQNRMPGLSLQSVAPEINALLLQAKKALDTKASGQIELPFDGGSRIFNIRISGDNAPDAANFVVTLDDITELISAQRNAAWGDVARRIAHEIKNPLTPIQLSAERLKRKYGDEITSNREVFDRCTDTIIRHVSDIGRMVNEFSSFARMPEAVMKHESVREIIKSAVFPFQVAHSNITFTIDVPEEDISAYCDGRLLVQACTNLIKNATESIIENETTEEGQILVQATQNADTVRIDVIDNGVGLPEKTAHRLTEPYITTREKGTGLGLAIVRKVIEEHRGRVLLSNSTSLGASGAKVSLVFSKHNKSSSKRVGDDDDSKKTGTRDV